IEGLSLEAGNERVPVTASVGVVEWSPGETLSDTLRRADDALYAAKTAGRNCVVARADAAEALPGAS
ncbi:MAG: diguanylate cyclase, partial [Myxococcales bacterium]|nr:diguanylate cyclase [Myxococcales bacterium]